MHVTKHVSLYVTEALYKGNNPNISFAQTIFGTLFWAILYFLIMLVENAIHIL